ncbi:hypothetical protein HKX48_002017, partial [Thoreauomyces humboldtii]
MAGPYPPRDALPSRCVSHLFSFVSVTTTRIWEFTNGGSNFFDANATIRSTILSSPHLPIRHFSIIPSFSFSTDHPPRFLFLHDMPDSVFSPFSIPALRGLTEPTIRPARDPTLVSPVGLHKDVAGEMRGVGTGTGKGQREACACVRVVEWEKGVLGSVEVPILMPDVVAFDVSDAGAGRVEERQGVKASTLHVANNSIAKLLHVRIDPGTGVPVHVGTLNLDPRSSPLGMTLLPASSPSQPSNIVVLTVTSDPTQTSVFGTRPSETVGPGRLSVYHHHHRPRDDRPVAGAEAEETKVEGRTEDDDDDDGQEEEELHLTTLVIPTPSSSLSASGQRSGILFVDPNPEIAERDIVMPGDADPRSRLALAVAELGSVSSSAVAAAGRSPLITVLDPVVTAVEEVERDDEVLTLLRSIDGRLKRMEEGQRRLEEKVGSLEGWVAGKR